jgi:hypothetical protein
VILPDGVELTTLTMHRDTRGWLTEIFRNEWGVGVEPRALRLICYCFATLSRFGAAVVHQR